MNPSIKKLFKKTITEFIEKRNESLAGLKLGEISLDETKNPEKKFLDFIFHRLPMKKLPTRVLVI